MTTTEQETLAPYQIPPEHWNRAQLQFQELGPMLDVATERIYDRIEAKCLGGEWRANNFPHPDELFKNDDLLLIARMVCRVVDSATENFVHNDEAPILRQLVNDNHHSEEDRKNGTPSLTYFEYGGGGMTPGMFLREGMQTGVVMPVHAYFALEAQRKYGTNPEYRPTIRRYRTAPTGAEFRYNRLNIPKFVRTLQSDWFIDGLEEIAAAENGTLGKSSWAPEQSKDTPEPLVGRPWLLRHGRHPVIHPEFAEQRRRSMSGCRSDNEYQMLGSTGCPVRHDHFPVIGAVAMEQLQQWGVAPEPLQEVHPSGIARGSKLMAKIVDHVFARNHQS